MRALMITKYGNINDSLEFQTIEKPSINDNEVLIKTHAASINPIDYKVLKGDLKIFKKLSFPAPIGYDVSGVIEQVGVKVKKFKVGDKVFSRVAGENVGTLADYVSAQQTHISLLPENMSFSQGATIPLVVALLLINL